MIAVTRRSRIAQLTAAIPRACQQQVNAAAERIAAHARTLVPVQTGALKGSIEPHPEGIFSAVVQAGGGGHTTPEGRPVNYAAAVEFGGGDGKSRPAKPFMRPAAMEEAPRFPREVAEAIRREMR